MKKLLIGGLIFGSISSFAQIDYLAQMYVDNSNYEKKTPVKISTNVKGIKLYGKVKIEANTRATPVNDSCFITHESLDDDHVIDMKTLKVENSDFLLFLNEKKGWFKSYKAEFGLSEDLKGFICVLPFKDELPSLYDFELEISEDAELVEND